MAQRMKEVDVVVIGVGMVGSIVAKELAAAGYKVVGLERGQARFTVPEFQSPAIHDELRFGVRKALMQDSARETLTFRNHASQLALPVRNSSTSATIPSRMKLSPRNRTKLSSPRNGRAIFTACASPSGASWGM